MRSWLGGGILPLSNFAGSILRNKGESDGGYDTQERHQMVPSNFFAEIKKGECAEDSEGDHFLDDLELGGAVDRTAPAIGWDLQDIFEKRNAPTDNDDEEEGS